MKILFKILFAVLIYTDTYPCNVCGGGTSDISVLALDGKALFNVGFSLENFSGTWDTQGKWHRNKFSHHQYKITLGTAFRFSKNIQCAFSVPIIFSRTSLIGLKQYGAGPGDISIRGRFEIFHEFQPKKKNKKLITDRTLPYLAIIGGINLPTGISEENAENDIDITGSGFFSTVLGISLTKSLIRQKFQVIGDLNWYHSFRKKYSKYFGEVITYAFSKQLGEKINYSVTANFIINNWHAFSFSVNGLWQGKYKINDIAINDSEARNLNFTFSYTYYPSTPFRITSSLKLTPKANNLGINNQTSDLFTVNLTYYIANY